MTGKSENDVEAGKEVMNPGSQGDSPHKAVITPQMLAAMNSPAIERAAFIHTLPPAIRRRLRALKKLQYEEFTSSIQFFEELHSLEAKYAKKFAPFRNKRRDIVNGSYEPNDEECDFTLDESEVAEELACKMERAELDDKEAGDKSDLKGIPDFWLLALQGFDMCAEMIQEHDEPILKKLTDIQCHLIESPMGFKIEFHFAPNDFFTDSVLTKEYQLRCEISKDDPWNFEGTEIVKATGCTIHWKEGKNITQKVVKKRQKHKQKGTTRMVEKVVQRDSFFNFFSPPEEAPHGDDEESDEETTAILAADYEIGHYLKERLCARATLYFTGDAVDPEDYGDNDEEDEEAGDDGEESDPDFKPGRKLPAVAGTDKPQECQQQ